MASARNRSRGIWAGLALIAAVFVVLVWAADPVADFAHYHDDALYFSSAKAIASGEGHVLPSLPGKPPQTKYPPLYPYLLSLVWLLVPSFPSNLAPAIALSTICGVGVLIASFLLLERFEGAGPRIALLCVALCAGQEWMLIMGGNLLSEMVFAVLALTAFLLAENSRDSKRALAFAAAAGTLAGLALLTRSVGTVVIAGIGLSLLVDRRWRAAAAFSAATLPFFAWSVISRLSATVELPPSSAPGWRQTWLYYLDYGASWRMSVPDADTLLAMVQANLLDLLTAPAAMCLGPEPVGFFGTLGWITISVGIIFALIRQAKADRLRAVHLAFLLMIPIVMLWNFSISKRLLLIFLPFFYLGLWLEARNWNPQALRPGAGRGTEKSLNAYSPMLIIAAEDGNDRANHRRAGRDALGFQTRCSGCSIMAGWRIQPDILLLAKGR